MQANEKPSDAGDPYEHYSARLPTQTRFEIRAQVFVPAATSILLFVALGAVYSDALSATFRTLQDWIALSLGWFYALSASIFLGFVIWLGFSRYGAIRLGPDSARPDYSYLAWFAMLFSAGMGIGLLFFSVSEPAHHFGIAPPPSTRAEPETPRAAETALLYTFFHWGMHAWAIYIIIGLALCYYAYRRGLPLAMRSAFYPLLGERVFGWPGDIVDTLAIVGTLFGVATSLGLGVIQINAGLGYLVGLPPSLLARIVLIAIITAVATLSVLSGLDRGIRRLSLANVFIGGALTLFVLVVGPTRSIFAAFVNGIGDYVQQLPALSMGTSTVDQPEWRAEWTLFYWGWWVSWSPFVGMFVARISRGRTVREFVAGVLLVPTVVTFFIVTVFGQSGLMAELEGRGSVVQAAADNPAYALFALLETLPLPQVTSIVALLVIVTFFITSSDSGSLVDDIHASGGSLTPHKATRIFWALTEGMVASVLLAAGGRKGLDALQQASLATGIPLAVLLLGACWALVRAFRREL